MTWKLYDKFFPNTLIKFKVATISVILGFILTRTDDKTGRTIFANKVVSVFVDARVWT